MEAADVCECQHQDDKGKNGENLDDLVESLEMEAADICECQHQDDKGKNGEDLDDLVESLEMEAADICECQHQDDKGKNGEDLDDLVESLEMEAADVCECQHQDDKGKNGEDWDDLVEGLGKCKWFDIAKGYGFITPEVSQSEEPKDVFVYQSTIQMQGFRSLRQGEEVRLWYKSSPLGLEAVKVCGPSGKDCVGSEKPTKRKKISNRCFNCGEEGHHAKECPHPPLPKRCYCCKAVEHLEADCPIVRESVGDSMESKKQSVMDEELKCSPPNDCITTT